MHCEKWEIAGDKVRLDFPDKTSLYVRKKDFDRAFGCIIALPKELIEKEYAVSMELT